MELTAVLEGLKYFQEPCNITFYSDSEYVVNGLNYHIKDKMSVTDKMANSDI